MKFEIKNVKYAAFASQETHCFNAKLYVDGKAFAEVNNDGHGGCDDVYPLNNEKDIPAWRKRLDAIEAELAKEVIDCDFTLDDSGTYQLNNSLEIVVGELMNDWLQAKEIKKILKRIAYVKPDCAKGEFYKAPARVKPTAAGIAMLKSQKWWKPEYVILNELPVAEAAAYL